MISALLAAVLTSSVLPAQAGGDPTVQGFRGDRRMRSVGYVEWVPRIDTSGYQIEWATASDGPWMAVTDQPFVGREILMRGMPSTETVYVRMRAVFKDGTEGPNTAVVSIPPLGD